MTMPVDRQNHDLDRNPRHDESGMKVRPVYVEAEPRGLRDAGDAGGNAQISDACYRRFTRPLPDEVHTAVLDVECYVLNTEDDPYKPERPVLTRTLSVAVCTDPADVVDTTVDSQSHSEDLPRTPGDGELTDEHARELCTRFDPADADLSWAADLLARYT
ncbi:hypothetical protein [Amycolatopsis magusensis]|uniref:hypothetical protein n=1 Tax=Amycolatopsis magusensis TaxID=882444 RepID=UPI0037A1F265